MSTSPDELDGEFTAAGHKKYPARSRRAHGGIRSWFGAQIMNAVRVQGVTATSSRRKQKPRSDGIAQVQHETTVNGETVEIQEPMTSNDLSRLPKQQHGSATAPVEMHQNNAAGVDFAALP